MSTLPWVCWKLEGSRSWFRLTFLLILILARAAFSLERCFNIIVFQAPPHFTPWPMSRSYTSTWVTHNHTPVMHRRHTHTHGVLQVRIRVQLSTLAKWILSFVSFRSLVLLMISCRTEEYFCVSHTRAKSCLIFWWTDKNNIFLRVKWARCLS